MATAIAGIFDNATEACRAADRMAGIGMVRDKMSLVMSDKAGHRVFTGTTTLEEGEKDAVKGGVAGALLGGALGAIVAGLTTTSAVVIPGTGLLVAGPIVALLSGAGAGATIGGLNGALVAAGFSQDESGKYEEELRAGKAVLIVHTDSVKEEAMARSTLNDAGAATEAA